VNCFKRSHQTDECAADASSKVTNRDRPKVTDCIFVVIISTIP
jgi:hypothetical protein